MKPASTNNTIIVQCPYARVPYPRVCVCESELRCAVLLSCTDCIYFFSDFSSDPASVDDDEEEEDDPLLPPDCCESVSPIFMEAVLSAWILAFRSGRSSDCSEGGGVGREGPRRGQCGV
jgi:hypothetical protein